MVLKRKRSLTHTRHSHGEILVKFALVDTQPVRVLFFLFLISSLSFSFLINAYYLFATRIQQILEALIEDVANAQVTTTAKVMNRPNQR